MDQDHGRRATQVIAIGNQKGGVAKTTNAVHVATALGAKGLRCLIWDLDMNHGATLHFGIPSESFLGTFEVLIGEEQPRTSSSRTMMTISSCRRTCTSLQLVVTWKKSTRR